MKEERLNGWQVGSQVQTFVFPTACQHLKNLHFTLKPFLSVLTYIYNRAVQIFDGIFDQFRFHFRVIENRFYLLIGSLRALSVCS